MAKGKGKRNVKNANNRVRLPAIRKTINNPAIPKQSKALQVGNAIGTAIGSAIAGPAGGAIGGLLGKGAGTLFKKITGMGDYNVTSNTLINAAAQDALPAFSKAERGVRILHREYLYDLITSASAGVFKVQSVPIQPALSSSFPWLGPVAQQFEEYQLNGVIYEFKSNSYDALASTNTASGTVVMATQYNVLNPAFVNKAQMEQYMFSCSSKPSVNLMHPVECKRGESMVSVLSTRLGPVLTGDQRLYDFGNFFIATVGMQGTSVNVGELWVSYDITLLKPRLGNVSDLVDHYYLGPLANIRTDGTGNGYFGNTPLLSSSSSFGTILGLNTITLPSSYVGGIALIYTVLLTSSQVWAQIGASFTSQITALNIVSNGGYSVTAASNSIIPAGTTSTIGEVLYYTTTGGGTFTFNGGSAATSAIKSADLYVCSLPNTLTN